MTVNERVARLRKRSAKKAFVLGDFGVDPMFQQDICMQTNMCMIRI